MSRKKSAKRRAGKNAIAQPIKKHKQNKRRYAYDAVRQRAPPKREPTEAELEAELEAERAFKTSQAKRQAVFDARNPLRRLDVLQLVLELVGAGEWLFVAVVSKQWAAAYQKVPSHFIQAYNYNRCRAQHENVPRQLLCSHHMTLCRAVCANPARYSWAHNCGFTVGHGMHDSYDDILLRPQREFTIGRCADTSILSMERQLGLDWGEEFISGVALTGNLETLRHACDMYDDGNLPYEIQQYAVRSGNMEMLAWYEDRGGEVCKEESCALAAASGSLEMMEYVYVDDCEDIDECFTAAAAGGHLAVLQYLRIVAPEEWSADYVRGSAARSGNVAMMQWLQQDGATLDGTFSAAAGAGQRDMCEYLIGQGCAWDAAAAWNAAAHSGCVTRLQYMLTQEPLPSAALLTSMLAKAGGADHLLVAQWLRDHGKAAWPAKLESRNEPWGETAVEWARAEGCTSHHEPPEKADDDWWEPYTPFKSYW